MLRDQTMKDIARLRRLKDKPLGDAKTHGERDVIRSGQGLLMMTQSQNDAIEAIMRDAKKEEQFMANQKARFEAKVKQLKDQRAKEEYEDSFEMALPEAGQTGSKERLGQRRQVNIENVEGSTGQGQYTITDTWTDHLKHVALEYDEQQVLRKAVAAEKARYKAQAEREYGPEKHQSIMMGRSPQAMRSEVMQNVEYQRLVLKNMHEFKRAKREQILNSRKQKLALTSSPSTASSLHGAPPKEVRTEASVRKGFEEYVESLCLRSANRRNQAEEKKDAAA